MMLHTAYKDFLTSPDISFLAEDISLYHVTTLTTSHGSSAVMKHFESNDFKITRQKFLDVVEGQFSLAVIVDTTLEFITGGGPYLLSLDDHFFVDRPVTLPITHFVTFNSYAKITQIRLSWDQGCLLKLISVIGKTGRNWPICGGDDQSKLITSCVEKKANSQICDKADLKEASENHKNAVRNSPHFPYYGSSRLFDTEGDQEAPSEKCHNPTRFKHFEFANGAPNEGSDPARIPIKKNRPQNHWDFKDFVTPQKNIPSRVMRSNDVRHWGNDEDGQMNSSERVKKFDKPRRDFETHFTLQDTPSDTDGQAPHFNHSRGHVHKNSQSLYRDLFDEKNGVLTEAQKPILPHLSNVKDRRKDFEAHFTMSDKSPGITPTEGLSEDGAKEAKTAESSNYFSGNLSREKENTSDPNSRRNNRHEGHKGIRTDGDGMGGKKGTGRLWGFGDESDGEEEGGINKPVKYRTGKQAGKGEASGGDFWNF
ncbi:hypothetical protein GcM3_097010 [Golovinomyces cichoracearum]|uniref:Ntf2-like protein n=1 Tax=Golovinomyces cichoracearum TaxID=62708 RepID=A0A420IDJ3_9PEZI|nr:hypothetical protein GcM3_097010 [Golovinomyces cichoracearum]